MSDIRVHKDRAAAQLAKGRVDKALEEFLCVLRVQPTDLVVRQRVGELYQRLGRATDAIREYQHVAGRYAVDGQPLKAIACCKLILRLDPAHVETQKVLADLYARHRGTGHVGKLPASMAAALPAARPTEIALPDEPSAPLVLTQEVEIVVDAPGQDDAIAVDSSEMEIEVLEESPAPRGIAVAGLPRIPLFSDLGPGAFMSLSDRLQLVTVKAGDVIVREGELGRSMYAVVQGGVDVVRQGDGGTPVVVARMGEGEFFGEMALIADVPRLATVVANADGMLFDITREKIAEMVAEHPSMAQVIERFHRERLLANLMRSSALFRPLSELDRQRLVVSFKTRRVQPGVALLTQGQPGNGFYVVLRGRCAVSFCGQDGRPHALPELREGDVFGEISLMTQVPATATVVTTQPCVLMRLSPEAFSELIATQPSVRQAVAVLAQERLGRTHGAPRQVPARV